MLILNCTIDDIFLFDLREDLSLLVNMFSGVLNIHPHGKVNREYNIRRVEV